MDEKIETWPLLFPAKENPNMALFDWPIVLQHDVKAKYRLISEKLSDVKSFPPSIRLTNQRHAGSYPFDKPIKSLYFSSFVVFVLFARFHFKVIKFALINDTINMLRQRNTSRKLSEIIQTVFH